MAKKGRPRNDDPKRRERIIEDLEEAVKQYSRWCVISVHHLSEEDWEWFQADYRDLEIAVVSASRVGVSDHPVVTEWLATKRVFGERQWLRRCGKGLEKGVKPTLSNIDTLLSYEAATLLDEKRMSYTEVRWMLLKKLSQPDYKPPDWLDISEAELEEMTQRLKTSNQNFHKWLRRVGPCPRLFVN